MSLNRNDGGRAVSGTPAWLVQDIRDKQFKEIECATTAAYNKTYNLSFE